MRIDKNEATRQRKAEISVLTETIQVVSHKFHNKSQINILF